MLLSYRNYFLHASIGPKICWMKRERARERERERKKVRINLNELLEGRNLVDSNSFA